jgi:uncharacterized RmlC-like cupin family protein
MNRTPRHPRLLAVIALGGLAGAACNSTAAATTSSNPAALARNMSVDLLVAGKLDALPTGSQFVRVTQFIQKPGVVAASKKHQVGIIYQQNGTQTLTYEDAQNNPTSHVAIAAGTAVWCLSVFHTHANNGTIPNEWYFLALWPSDDQSVVPSGISAYQTALISQSALSPGAYSETLRAVTLQAGGQSTAHTLGGLEVIYLLSGTLTVNVAGQPPAHLVAEPKKVGTYVAPDTATQEFNTGSTAATYLEYLVIPSGKAIQRDLSQPVPAS